MEKNNVIVADVKNQIKVHIDLAMSELLFLLDYVEGTNDFQNIKQEIHSKSQSTAQHILHSLALVTKRAKLDHELDAIFAAVKKEVEYQVDASKIKVPHGAKGRVDILHQTEDERLWCDLSQDQTLTVEKIVKSTLSNPLKDKYLHLPWGHHLFDKDQTAELYLDFLRTKCPKALAAFDGSNIRLHDTSRFDLSEADEESVTVDKNKWLKKLKSSRFYGPFQSNYNSAFSFQTVTEDGSFDGIRLTIDFVKHAILLSYSTDHSQDAGKPYEFFDREL